MCALASAKDYLDTASHFIDISGFRMHYLDEGQGAAVLMLHGNPTWCYYYRNLITLLKPNFRCIAPDHLGMGLSEHPKETSFRAKERAEHIEALLDELGIDEFSLVMHDWGGPIGTRLATKLPGRVRSLIYLNTILDDTKSLPLLVRLSARGALGRFLTEKSRFFLLMTLLFGTARRLPRDVREAYLAPYRDKMARKAIGDFVADIPFDGFHETHADMLELKDELPLLSSFPTLLVWGLKDPCFGGKALDNMRAIFPDAKVEVFPNASHLVLEDEPERACKSISSFLEENQSESGVARHRAPRVAPNNGLEPPLLVAFRRWTRERPRMCAVMDGMGKRMRRTNRGLSFEELASSIQKYRNRLVRLGLEPGHKVVMLVKPGRDFIAYSYATIAEGGIPVFLDPGMGLEALCNCIGSISPEGFIGSPKAQLLRLKRRGIFANLRFHITSNLGRFPRRASPCATGNATTGMLEKLSFRSSPSSPCLVAFTSGATGSPKGVIYTHSMIEEMLRIFGEDFGMHPFALDLPLLPVFSIFSPALGIGVLFPEVNPAKPLSLDPEGIARSIESAEVDHSFGSPTLWARILSYCDVNDIFLPSPSKIFMAGAPVPPKTLELAKRVCPNASVYTPYGATEALPVTLVDAEEIETSSKIPAIGNELGTFVGGPVSGLSLKIIKPEKGPIASMKSAVGLPPRYIGEVVVMGKNVSPSYLRDAQASQMAKIPDGKSFWHRMGDMGYTDDDGNLYFCGRKAHVVCTPKRVFYSVPTERIFNEHPAVFRSALIRHPEADEAAIVVEPRAHFWKLPKKAMDSLPRELRQLAKQNAVTADIRTFFIRSSFPVDARHNAKIFRDKLARWAANEGKSDMISFSKG